MAYVIKRAAADGGGYVAPAGSASSYVAKLQDARTWPTREAAQKECCGNETVCDVLDEVRS